MKNRWEISKIQSKWYFGCISLISQPFFMTLELIWVCRSIPGHIYTLSNHKKYIDWLQSTPHNAVHIDLNTYPGLIHTCTRIRGWLIRGKYSCLTDPGVRIPTGTDKDTNFLICGWSAPLPNAQNPAGIDLRKCIREIRDLAHESLFSAQASAKAYYDPRRGKSWDFKVGQQVWLEATNIKLETGTKKLAAKGYGPFTIVDEIPPSSYKLDLPDAWHHLHPVFNEVLLTPYTPPSSASHAPPPPIIVDDKPEYNVDSIVRFNMMHRRPFYEVRWEGYQPFDNTWEPLANLDGAGEAINDFHARNPSIKKPATLLHPPISVCFTDPVVDRDDRPWRGYCNAL